MKRYTHNLQVMCEAVHLIENRVIWFHFRGKTWSMNNSFMIEFEGRLP